MQKLETAGIFPRQNNQYDAKQLSSSFIILETGLSISFMEIHERGGKINSPVSPVYSRIFRSMN